MDHPSRLAQLAEIVNAIPPGHVASYGWVGRQLPNPVSGFLAGKWMASIQNPHPWWRVVGANGDLLVAKRGPEYALEQRRLLESEDVTFTPTGQVARRHFYNPDP